MQPPSMQPEVTITWVGHATVEFEVDGFRAITDPILTSRVVHLRRRVEVPTIDPVDAVLISHLHMDHLHLRSLRTVTDGVRVIAPRGSAKLFRSLGITQLDEVVAGDVVTLREARGDDSPAIEARVVPADHSNARGPHSRIVAEPVGYIVNAGRRSVYFAGDTDLFEGMHDFPEIDVALLPIISIPNAPRPPPIGLHRGTSCRSIGARTHRSRLGEARHRGSTTRSQPSAPRWPSWISPTAWSRYGRVGR